MGNFCLFPCELISDPSIITIIKVRTGKKFLPHAVRYGKRYYQRRKYSSGMYAGMGGATGYYAGSRMHGHHGPYYTNSKERKTS